jgi:hypothetical protein
VFFPCTGGAPTPRPLTPGTDISTKSRKLKEWGKPSDKIREDRRKEMLPVPLHPLAPIPLNYTLLLVIPTQTQHDVPDLSPHGKTRMNSNMAIMDNHSQLLTRR